MNCSATSLKTAAVAEARHRPARRFAPPHSRPPGPSSKETGDQHEAPARARLGGRSRSIDRILLDAVRHAAIRGEDRLRKVDARRSSRQLRDLRAWSKARWR